MTPRRVAVVPSRWGYSSRYTTAELVPSATSLTALSYSDHACGVREPEADAGGPAQLVYRLVVNTRR